MGALCKIQTDHIAILGREAALYRIGAGAKARDFIPHCMVLGPLQKNVFVSIHGLLLCASRNNTKWHVGPIPAGERETPFASSNTAAELGVPNDRARRILYWHAHRTKQSLTSLTLLAEWLSKMDDLVRAYNQEITLQQCAAKDRQSPSQSGGPRRMNL